MSCLALLRWLEIPEESMVVYQNDGAVRVLFAYGNVQNDCCDLP